MIVTDNVVIPPLSLTVERLLNDGGDAVTTIGLVIDKAWLGLKVSSPVDG